MKTNVVHQGDCLEVMAAFPDLFIDDMPIDEAETTKIDFEVRLPRKEEVLIDEPLPRLPLTSQPIKVKLKMGGWGKPTFRIIETEISRYDDE